jgi:hypothetical protein
MVRPERFELPTCCSGGNRSIQLSYGRARMFTVYMGKGNGINVADRRPGDSVMTGARQRPRRHDRRGSFKLFWENVC